MLFDNKTLEPIFKLIIGEAGSSFTFEVAQKMGSHMVLSIELRKNRKRESTF